ncbi:probable disease resistance protein RF9 [Quercus suber]|uniref:probable disease resistance protein RF9 n=1 Tax=Quercus suber TaxID=58331 RepID=UPI0032DE7163
MLEWEEWDGMRESCVSELVLIMPRLQVLTIDVCPKLKSLPNFLEKTSLEELTIDCRISNCMTLATLPGLKSLSCVNLNNGEHFSTLGKLLLLESLWISNTERVKKVSVEFLGIEEESNNNNKIDDEKGSASSSSSSPLVLFPNLKSLKFWDMEEWEEWDGIGGTMREEAQKSGVTITIMPRLQYLNIWECPKLKSLPDFLPTTPLKTLRINASPILRECCKTVIGDQWPKISHIPNIFIDFTYVRRDGRPTQY